MNEARNNLKAELVKAAEAGNGRQSMAVQALETTEQNRIMAEIQAQLTVAQLRPRDELECLKKIERVCERLTFAENAEYSYQRGGKDITGPSIRLMEVVAQRWGNLNWGFRELSNADGESTVEAFAWDMETNAKEVRAFVVKHARKAGAKIKQLKDPRDAREMVANMAQRNVRSCLEHVIPRDIWEHAVSVCKKTVLANVTLDNDTLLAMVESFEATFGVTKGAIEKRIGRPLLQIEPAQYLKLRSIWSSLRDGLTEASDWFELIDDDGAGIDELLRRNAGNGESVEPVKEPSASEQAANASKDKANDQSESMRMLNHYGEKLREATTVEHVDDITNAIETDDNLTKEHYEEIIFEANGRRAELDD